MALYKRCLKYSQSRIQFSSSDLQLFFHKNLFLRINGVFLRKKLYYDQNIIEEVEEEEVEVEEVADDNSHIKVKPISIRQPKCMTNVTSLLSQAAVKSLIYNKVKLLQNLTDYLQLFLQQNSNEPAKGDNTRIYILFASSASFNGNQIQTLVSIEFNFLIVKSNNLPQSFC